MFLYTGIQFLYRRYYLARITQLPHLGVTLSESITFVKQATDIPKRERQFFYTDEVAKWWPIIFIWLVNLWAKFPFETTSPAFLSAVIAYEHHMQATYLVGGVAFFMLLGVFLWFAIAVRLNSKAEGRNFIANLKYKPIFILYLRSFEGERKKKQSWGMHFISRLLPAVSWEKIVLSPLSYVGPLIAIGSPNEKLAKFPGYVHYTSNEDWQETVKELISSATAIVVCAADTDAVAWELRQVLEEDDLDRLLVLLPPGPSDVRRKAWLRVLSSFSQGQHLDALPELDVNDVIGMGVWRGNIIHFRGNGRRIEQWQDCVTAFSAGILTLQRDRRSQSSGLAARRHN